MAAQLLSIVLWSTLSRSSKPIRDCAPEKQKESSSLASALQTHLTFFNNLFHAIFPIVLHLSASLLNEALLILLVPRHYRLT
jgi:hypothetical protein